MGTIKDRNGMGLTETEDIKKRLGHRHTQKKDPMNTKEDDHLQAN